MRKKLRNITFFIAVSMFVMMISNKTAFAAVSKNLNTSPGNVLFEFDSSEDLKTSTTSSVKLDENNYVSGKASVNIEATNPIAIEGEDTSYYTITTSQTVNDKLKDMKNIEFNLFIADKSQIDYLVINFYTDSSHNYFYQNAIGTWELSNGWNKIRRPVSDFTFINSIATSKSAANTFSASNEKVINKGTENNFKALKEDGNVEAEKIKLSNKVANLNSMNNKKAKAILPQRSGALYSYNTATPSYRVASKWDCIDNMEIFVAFKNGSKPNMNFDKVAYNVAGPTKVMFTFDDAWYDVKKYAEPILSEKGYKATTWANKTDSVASNKISNRGALNIMNESDLQELYAKGWDIGNHTANHYDDVTLLSDDKMRSEYLTNQNWLLSKGWTRGAYHACYPSGSYNEKLIQILKEIGVKSGRCTEYGIQPTPVYDMYKLKTVFISRDTPIADIKAQIDKAVETGSSLFFMLHRVEDTLIYTDESEYNPLAVSTEHFKEIVDYVSSLEKQGKLDVNTISQWYDEYMK